MLYNYYYSSNRKDSVASILSQGLIFHVDKSISSSLTVNSGIQQWNDLSSSGANMVQNTETNRPETASPLINFNGTDNWLTAGDVLDFERTDPFSIFLVYKTSAATTANIEHAVAKTRSASAFGGWALRIRGDAADDPWEFVIANNGATNGAIVRFPRDNDAEIHVIACTYNGTSLVSGMACWFDGVSQILTTVSDTLSLTTVTDAAFSLGSRNITDLPFSGGIGEVLIFNRKLNNREVTVLNSYMIGKWQTNFPNSQALTIPAATVPYSATDVPMIYHGSYSSSIVNPFKDDNSDLFFIKSDLSTVIPHKVAVESILDSTTNAAWTFANVGNARASGVYRYLTWYDVDPATNTWNIGQYNTSTSTWTTHVLGTGPTSQEDDHNNPTVIIDDDGYIYAFAVEHNTTALDMYKSDSPHDVSSFTRTNLHTVLGLGASTTSYSMTEFFSNSDTIVLSYRIGLAEREITFSTDGGATWTAPVDLVTESGERPYILIRSDGVSTLHIFFVPSGPAEQDSDAEASLYYGYLDMITKKLHKADGTEIGDLGTVALTKANATLVDDMSVTSTGSPSFFLEDMAVAADGSPTCLYSLRLSATDIRFRYARLVSAVWTTQELTTNGQSIQAYSFQTSGGRYYSASGTFLDADTVFLSKFDTTNTLPISGIHKFVTANEGTSFTESTVIPHIGENKVRPVVFRGVTTSDIMQFAYMKGKYLQYDNGPASGYASSLDNEIAVWPNGGSITKVYAMLEVDLDGVTDYDIKMMWNNAEDYAETTPFSTALYSILGEVENRVLKTDNTGMDAAASLTFVGRIHPDVISPGATMDFFSDLESDGTAENTHVLFRLNSSRQLDFRFVNDTPTVSTSKPTTDFTVTDDTWHGVGGKFTAGTISQFLNGAKSTQTQTLTGPIGTANAADDLNADQTHNGLFSFRGRLGPYILYTSAQTDDWIQAATLGLEGDVVVAE